MTAFKNHHSTVWEYFGVPPKDERRKFGVEIEVEGRNLPREVPGWHVTRDGSLRGPESFEYVLRGPKAKTSTFNAIGNLDNAYREYMSDVDESNRAGVHVHLNVGHWTMTHLFNFLTVYYTFEDFLCDFCGPERVGNHFCLRISDAMAPVIFLVDGLERGGIGGIINERFRYAALNLTAMGEHGSLEFRQMRSTRDLDEIKKWINIIDELSDNTSKFYGYPRDIVEQMSGDGVDALIERFLPTYGEEIIKSNKDYDFLVRRGMRRIQEMAFVYGGS